MLYLNLLNRLFGASKGISREEIESYSTLTEATEKQKIEEKSHIDDFESDAFEGWENINVTETMQRLDQRWNKKNTFNKGKKYLKWSLISLAGLFTLSIVLINFSEKETLSYTPKALISENTTVTLERTTDSIFEKELESLAIKEVEKQINSKKVRKQVPLITVEKVDTVSLVEDIPTGNLGTIELNAKPIEPGLTQKKLLYKSKKETYLHDLKVVDYTAYRSTPIETERLVLSGTTADKANKDVESTGSAWQKVDIPYIEYLDKSMELFGKGKYKKALSRFNQILVVYPEDVNALFYGGLCYYNLNQNELALNSFSSCYSLAYGNFREEAEWLKYLVYKENNNLEKAAVLLNKIINENGYYSEQAKKERK